MEKQNFGELPADEQARIGQELGQILKQHDIKTKVKIYREEVCQFKLEEHKGRTMLNVSKDLPSGSEEKAQKFNEAVKEYKEKYEGITIDVGVPLGVGSKFRTITDVTTIEDSTTKVNIEHIPGKVMFIDFWATWCPPCQRPMQHNQDMLNEHGAKWGDNVQIIGLSIDQDAKKVVDHVNNKGWTSVKHYFRSESDCSKVYKVNGVPHVMILDKEGTIVFKGHPANRKDLVKDFNDLLEGKALEDAPQPGGADEEEEEAGGEIVTLDDIKSQFKQCNDFKEISEWLRKECKEQGAKMVRDFSVLTVAANYNPEKEQWTSEFTNHRVMQGDKESVEHCKAKVAEKMGTADDMKGWTFKINQPF